MPNIPNRSSCSGGAAGFRRAPCPAAQAWLLLASLALLLSMPGVVWADDEAPAASAPADVDGVPESAARVEAPRPSQLTTEDREQLHRVLLGGRAYRARVQAAIMLGRRGSPEEDLSTLRRALRDDSHYTVRGAAAMAIGNLGSPRGIEPLLMAAGDHHSFVRRSARNAIGSLAMDERAVPYLLLAREREAAHVRLAAVGALGELGCEPSRSALMEFFGDREPGVRAAVLEKMEKWERDDAVVALASALRHPTSFHVRASAAQAAAAYPDERLIDALVDRLVAPLEEPRVQVAAHTSLEEMRDHLDVEELVKRVQGVPDREVRVRSILLLGIKGGDRAVDVLLRTLVDPNLRVRYYSVMALGQAGDTRAAQPLLRAQRDPDNARIQGTITKALEDLSRLAAAE